MQLATRARRFSFEDGFEVVAAAHRLEAEGRSIVHLDLGEPDFATPANILEAGERALREGHTHYTAPGGLVAARVAVAEHLRRTRGVAVDPEEVLLTSGASQGLLLSMLALVQPGGSVILPDPCYPVYPGLVQMAGGRPVLVPLREELGFRFDLDELAAAIDPGTQVIVLNSPHNPTGGILPADDLRAIGALAERHGLHVVSDEVYGDLVYEGRRAPSMLSVPGMRERVVCIDSLSKTYAMCGWRLGFAAAPRALAERLEMLMFMAGLCAPSIAQVAAIEALGSPASTAAVDRMREAFRERRRVVMDLLAEVPGVRCHRPQGAFYAFPDIRGTGMDDRALAHRLLYEGGVAGLPGSAFGSRGAGHLRLSYAAATAHIVEGVRRISAVLGGGA